MILARFTLLFSFTGNFGACNMLTTGLRYDLREVLYKFSLTREYKTQIEINFVT